MIKKIYSVINNNKKTFKNHKELLTEIRKYKELNSISLKIEFTSNKVVELSLLSITYFIITGKIQENI